MSVRKALCLMLMFLSLSVPASARQRLCDNWELQQELNIIKQGLDQNENTLKTSDQNSLQQKITDVLRDIQAQKDRIQVIEDELKSNNSGQNFIKKVNSDSFPDQSSLNSSNISNISGNSIDDYKRQLDIASNTIINQTKQLSKAYSEIENLKRSTLTTDKFVDNMINQAERLRSMGKAQEAITIYEALDRLNVKKPRIYQNMGSIYQSMGMTSEADKQFSKLNSPSFNSLDINKLNFQSKH
jgi:tetratricopeptide (TPR) repeat protein